MIAAEQHQDPMTFAESLVKTTALTVLASKIRRQMIISAAATKDISHLKMENVA